MGGNDNGLCAVALCNAGGYGQEYTIAEGNHRLLEIFFCVVCRRNGICPAEKGTLQVGRNTAQVNLMVGNAQFFCLPTGTCQLFFGMITAVVKGEGSKVRLWSPTRRRVERLLSCRAILGLMLGRTGKLNAATGTELAFYLHPCRFNSCYQVI